MTSITSAKNNQLSDTLSSFFGKNVNLAHIKLISLFMMAFPGSCSPSSLCVEKRTSTTVFDFLIKEEIKAAAMNGFREFTHPQTVLTGKTCCNLPLREHPYNGKAEKQKLSFLRWFER